jgi:proteasome beta subunit
LAIAIAGQLSDAGYLIKVVKSQKRLMELRRGYSFSILESAKLISNLAYSGLKSYQPYYVELLVAGTDELGNHIYVADMIGAIIAEPIASSGSGAPIAYGVLESLFNPDMNIDDIKELAKKAVLAAMERDPGSGNGVDVVSIMTNKIKVSPVR